MSEHEYDSHELLAGMVARADPAAVETRARALLDLVPMIREVGDLIAARVASMEWRGEAAEVLRAWGDHFRQESATLSDYAEHVGGAMQVAAQVLAKVKSAMPPTRPSPLVPLADAGTFDQTMAELDRQEAIRLIDSLDSAYRIAGDTMSRAPEPRFEPLTSLDDWKPPREEALRASTSGGAPAPGYLGSASVPTYSGSGEEPQGFSVMPPSDPSVHRQFVNGAAAPGAVSAGDEWIGTSLDSVTSVPDTRPTSGPTIPPSPSPVPTPVGVADDFQFPVANSPSRVAPGPWPGPMNGGPTRTPYSGPQQPGPPSTMPPVSNVSPQTANAVNQHPGGGGAVQSPMPGRPPMTSLFDVRTSREADHSGIVGGVPRQPESHRRQVPQNGIVGAGMPPAVRDPATGVVRGPGGALVGRPAGYPGDESRSYPSRAGTELPVPRRTTGGVPSSALSGAGGRPSRPTQGRRRKRKRNDRAQQEKDH